MTTKTYDKKDGLPVFEKEESGSGGLPIFTPQEVKKKEPISFATTLAGAIGLDDAVVNSASGGEPTPQSLLQSKLDTEGIFSFANQRNKTISLPANIPRAVNDVNTVLAKVENGIVEKEDLAQLYQQDFGKRHVENIISTYAPELGTEGFDNESANSTQKWDELSKKIKVKNRTNATVAIANRMQDIDEELTAASQSLRTSKTIVSGGTGGAAASVTEIPIPAIDVNNPWGYGRVIEQLKGSDGVVDADGKIIKGKKEQLIKYLDEKAKYFTAKNGIDESVIALGDKVTTAITRANINREFGESIPVEEFAKNDALNEEHFQLGLSYIKNANPGQYKNIIRVIDEGKEVPDDDFRNLAAVGQQIKNQQIFEQSATNPELIDKETNIDYTTWSDKKAQYAAIIGERIKAGGGKNLSQYSEEAIRKAAADLPNKEIVNELVWEEKLIGYDAIPKSGAFESFIQGLNIPIDGIRSTFQLASESPAETYIRSKRLDTGSGQKVFDDKGQASNILPSDRGNIYYDALRGFGQFVPQVLLTKGIGGATAGVIGADVRLALTPAVRSGISTYGGTAISTFLQTYGDSYADYLQKTGDPATARLAGGIDATSAAAFELLLPDVKIADRAMSGLRGTMATDVVDLIRKGGDPAQLAVKARPFIQKFVTNALNISGQEIAEEVGTQVVDYITESVFSPKTVKDRDLGSEILETVKATAVSMAIPSLLGAGGTAINPDFTRNAFNAAAINFNDYKQALDKQLNNGVLNQEDYNAAISLLTTHRQSINAAPKQNINGAAVPDARQLDYAYEDTKIKIYKEKAAKSEGVAKEMWESKIKQSEDIQREIVMPKESEVPIEELTPEQILIAEANKGTLAGGYSDLLKLNPEFAAGVLLDYAQQKYGVTADGNEAEGGGREITNPEVDAAVTKAFPNKESVLVASKQTEQAPKQETITTGSEAGDVVPSTLEDQNITTDRAEMEGEFTDKVEINDEVVALPESGYVISGVNLKEGQEKGKGAGQEIYKKALDEHGVLYSFFPISEDALRVHDKLAEKGVATIEHITLPDGNEARKITAIKSQQQSTPTNEGTVTPSTSVSVIQPSQNSAPNVVPLSQAAQKATPTTVTPQEQTIPAELGTRVQTAEPPSVQGRTPVTLSGYTEDERKAVVEKRKSESFVPTQITDEQKLLDRINKYNKSSGTTKRSTAGRSEVNNIKLAVANFNKTHKQKYTATQNRAGDIEFKNTKNRTVQANNRATGDTSIDEGGVPLLQRSQQVNEVFNQLLERDVFPTAYTVDGRRMNESQLEGTIQDILDGIPSRAANNYLDNLEKQIEQNDFDFTTPEITDKRMLPKVTLDMVLGTTREQQTEPMTPESLQAWLNEQGELTPDQEQTVLDNIENLMQEYEPETTTTPSVQQSQPKTAAEVSEQVEQNQQPQTESTETTTVATDTQTNQPQQTTVDALTNELRALLGNQPLALTGDANPKTRVSFEDLGISDTDTIGTLIDKLIAYGGEFTRIFEAIKSDPNFQNVNLQLVNNRGGLENGESGLYYPSGYGEGMDNTLQIANKDNVYYTAAHELMHFLTLDSATANSIKNTPSYQALTDMYNYIVSEKGRPVAIAGGATVESYGLTNEKEFMAELLINPTFRKYVGDVFAANRDDIFKTSKAIRERKVEGIEQIILNFFKDLFNKIFSSPQANIPFNERQSVVDNAANLATQLFFGGENVISGQTDTGQGATVIGMGAGSRTAALALPSTNQNKIISDFVKNALGRGVSEADIKTALINNGISDADAQSFIDESKPQPAPATKPKSTTKSDNEVISTVLSQRVDARTFPTLFQSNEKGNQIAAETQGKGQDRIVNGEYVVALERDLREVSVQVANVLRQELGADWGIKTLEWIEKNPSNGNIAQVVGILNVISAENFQAIQDTHNGAIVNKLQAIQNRIDKVSLQRARDSSLGLRQRILYAQFAKGQPIVDVLADSILTPEMLSLKTELDEVLSEEVTDDELNSAPPLKTTQPAKKSTIRSVMGTAKKKSNPAIKDELISKGAEAANKTKKSFKDLINDAKDKLKNTKC